MDSSARMRAGWALAAVSSLALASSVALAAASSGQEKVSYTTVDQAAARAAIVRGSDLQPAGAWKGGTKKVTRADLAPLSCPGFHPKVSDLVVTGAADSTWSYGPDSLESLAVVLRTPKMVKVDWARSVETPGAAACAAMTLGKTVGSNVKVSSYRKLSFPHVAPYTAAFRFELVLTSQGITVPIVIDSVLVGRGRTELSLTSGGPKATAPSATYLARVARLLLARVRT
jgi:hypothetical protein